MKECRIDLSIPAKNIAQKALKEINKELRELTKQQGGIAMWITERDLSVDLYEIVALEVTEYDGPKWGIIIYLQGGSAFNWPQRFATPEEARLKMSELVDKITQEDET